MEELSSGKRRRVCVKVEGMDGEEEKIKKICLDGMCDGSVVINLDGLLGMCRLIAHSHD
jgi:hypothetical protein